MNRQSGHRHTLSLLALISLASCGGSPPEQSAATQGSSGSGGASSSSSGAGGAGGGASGACDALESTGPGSRWTIDQGAFISASYPWGAQMVDTGLPGKQSSLLVMPALDASKHPVLLVASFDGAAPPTGQDPTSLSVDVVPLSGVTSEYSREIVLRAARGAPGKVVVLLGAALGLPSGRSHWMVLDAATHQLDLDLDLGGTDSPELLAASPTSAESGWRPQPSSEVNHYWLRFM
jgi:hypothetical protein